MAVWIRWGVNEKLNKEAKQFLRRLAKRATELNSHIFVTSANDGIHREDSLHYTNDAFDHFRGSIKCVPDKDSELKRISGNNFDVLDEGNHVHSEFDPK